MQPYFSTTGLLPDISLTSPITPSPPSPAARRTPELLPIQNPGYAEISRTWTFSRGGQSQATSQASCATPGPPFFRIGLTRKLIQVVRRPFDALLASWFHLHSTPCTVAEAHDSICLEAVFIPIFRVWRCFAFGFGVNTQSHAQVSPHNRKRRGRPFTGQRPSASQCPTIFCR